MQFTYRDDKFRELMLYIAQQMENDLTFGATVLNKVMFFSDFLAYRVLGEPITGATYQKLDYGPAPRRLLPEQQRLTDEGRAVVQARLRGAKTQRRLVALDKPDLDLFRGSEIALVDQVIAALQGYGAAGVSELPHKASVGWLAVELHDDIPYGTIFLSPPKDATPSQVDRARELVGVHGTA